MKNKLILITGGAGFIGSNLACKLVDQGFKVRILDCLTPQVHGHDILKSYTYNIIKDKVEFINGNILSENDVLASLIGVDIIVHMAAETGTGQSMYDVSLHTNTNINGLANIYEQIIKNKLSIEKIIIPSSRSVYGEGKYLCGEHGIKYPTIRDESRIINGDFDFYCNECSALLEPIGSDELSSISLKSVYSYTKYSQEQLAELMSINLKIPTLIFRLQNVYGLGQSLTNPYTGIVSIFTNLIQNLKEISIFEDGKESRDFVYVDDVSNIISKLISIETQGCELFNIGSGQRLSVLDILTTISRLLKIDPIYKITGQYRLGDIRHNFANIDKLNTIFPHYEFISIDRGIREMLNWINNNEFNSINDKYVKSIDELRKFNLYK